MLKGVCLAHCRPGREGAEHDARNDVAKNKRLAQSPRQRAAQNGSDEDVREFLEDEGVFSHCD